MGVSGDYSSAAALEDVAAMVETVTQTEGIGRALRDQFPQLLQLADWLEDAMQFADRLQQSGMADLAT